MPPALRLPILLKRLSAWWLICYVVCSVPSRLGEHPGEATLLHGKAVKARSATSKIHTSGLWIDKLANQELLSQEESRTATPTREPGGGGLDLPI